MGAATTLTIEQSKINVVGSIDLSSELNFIGSNNKYIDVETLASNNSFNIRHHNPTGNLFENAFANGIRSLWDEQKPSKDQSIAKGVEELAKIHKFSKLKNLVVKEVGVTLSLILFITYNPSTPDNNPLR